MIILLPCPGPTSTRLSRVLQSSFTRRSTVPNVSVFTLTRHEPVWCVTSPQGPIAPR